MVIEAKRVADGSAEQFADWFSDLFPLNIPERLIDTADRRIIGNAAAPKVLAMHDLPEMLDAPRIQTDQKYRKVFDLADNAFGFPFQRSLTT